MLEWIKSWFKKPKEPREMLVWGIISGPYYDEQEECATLRVRMSIGNRVEDTTLWFQEEEDMAAILKHFKEGFGPYTLNIGEYELVK